MCLSRLLCDQKERDLKLANLHTENSSSRKGAVAAVGRGLISKLYMYMLQKCPLTESFGDGVTRELETKKINKCFSWWVVGVDIFVLLGCYTAILQAGFPPLSLPVKSLSAKQSHPVTSVESRFYIHGDSIFKCCTLALQSEWLPFADGRK